MQTMKDEQEQNSKIDQNFGKPMENEKEFKDVTATLVKRKHPGGEEEGESKRQKTE